MSLAATTGRLRSAIRRSSSRWYHAVDLGIDLKDIIVIGEKPCDIDMGRVAGATTFLVGTCYDAVLNALAEDFMVDDPAATTRLIRSHLWKERTISHGH